MRREQKFRLKARGALRTVALILVILGFIFSFSRVNGESKISISAKVDRATITIGDLITYSIIVDHEEDVQVYLPSLGENLGGFEIRDYTVHKPEKKDGRLIHRVDYIISTFETGEFEIPPTGVGYSIPPDTTRKILKTEAIKITVESLKPSEDGDIRDIKPPWEIPFNWKPILFIVLIVLFAGIFITALIFVIRKKRRGEAILPRKIEPPRPPHEIAYEELQHLSDSDLLQKGEIKKYYSRISDIIRRYIEGRYQILAMELTTTEVLDQMQGLIESEAHFPLFVEFLEACDLVKFAKYIPTEEENIRIQQLAFRIVDCTKWVEPLPAGEEIFPVEEGHILEKDEPAEAEETAAGIPEEKREETTNGRSRTN